MNNKVIKSLDWLEDRPLKFFIIYIFILYECVFFCCWINFGLTNLTLHGKITALIITLLLGKFCVYDYIKRDKQWKKN